MLGSDINPIVKGDGCRREVCGDRAFVLGGEVAEADYTSLDHLCGGLRRRKRGAGRRDSCGEEMVRSMVAGSGALKVNRANGAKTD